MQIRDMTPSALVDLKSFSFTKNKKSSKTSNKGHGGNSAFG